jgi:hypothetical protein
MMKRAPHRYFLSFVFCISSVLGLAGCATTKAAAVKKEPLVVPPAPPRVIAPMPQPQEESVTGGEREPVPQLPRQSRTSPRENAPRAEPKPPQQGMPGPTEAEAKPPAVMQPPPVAPAPELRTIDADTRDPAEATRQVRETMERAGRILAQIDYGKLAKASQLQYDMAKRFIEQSDEALKAKNFTAAQLMAEKAETIARELSGR